MKDGKDINSPESLDVKLSQRKIPDLLNKTITLWNDINGLGKDLWEAKVFTYESNAIEKNSDKIKDFLVSNEEMKNEDRETDEYITTFGRKVKFILRSRL